MILPEILQEYMMTTLPNLVKRVSSLLLVAASLLVLAPGVLFASDITSGDAYARFDEHTTTWTLGTAAVEEKLQFANGNYSLTSFQNKLKQREYVTGPNSSEEFRIRVNGETYTGTTGGWRWEGGEARVLEHGEIQLTVRMENDRLRVEKCYVVYPGTSIIRQWARYENVSSHPLKVEDPFFLSLRVGVDESSKPTLHYMTGGGWFTGSQILKEFPFSKAYARTFDSTDKPERTAVGGLNFGNALEWGSGTYLPWFCVRETALNTGLFMGFDYYGRWAAEIGNFYGQPGYLGLHVGGYNQNLASGESIETPKAFTGVFSGDLDDMGSQIKAWQYRYLWDYTRDGYFAKIRYAVELRMRPGLGNFFYGGGTQDNWDFRLAEIFRMVDILRYTGADILWQDAGWYDRIGDNDGPDLAGAKRYLAKHGMELTVWWPLYFVERESHAYQEHPEWISDPSTPQSHLDTSRREVIDYLLGQLNEKVGQWGDFQWRMDGEAVSPVNGNQTPMLTQYHNVTKLQSDFLRLHPGSSIDLCSGGGNLMGYESLRMSDVSQLTDGGSLFVANYYSSYLFPPDKIDDWTRDSTFTMETARSNLTMAAAWLGDHGVVDPQPGLWINNGLEGLRRNFEIYHYLVSQGVAGRWVQVYHPHVEGDDPIYYFERLSQDGKRGALILKHSPKGEVKIYPKGLRGEATYDVRFEMSKRVDSRTGADLMTNGIRLIDPSPGELIYLGLPNYPGSGNDHTPPTDPGTVQKQLGTNLGVTGVEVTWEASKDNNWLSYYQIYRDGEMLDKVAKGTYYFDHSSGPANLAARYDVQAVDGDGNGSRKVEARQSDGGPVIITAWGGFLAGKDYSFQGANGWTYEEWSGSRHTLMLWNGALGHMGLYEGTAGGRKATIGASWMRPGDSADAVRVLTLPYSGQVTITVNVRKDIHHTRGDGVRAKLLLGDRQLWPQTGWQTIAADDLAGKSMELNTSVHKGDKLYFVVNQNVDPEDDDTVWNPQITYNRIENLPAPPHRTIVDDTSSLLHYSGRGWQELGVGATRDQGYLPGRINGTLAVSGTGGDKVTLKFQGTGLELFGDVGVNRGVASISLDGKEVVTIDTYVPEGSPHPATYDSPIPIREPSLWNTLPSKRLWGIDGLPGGEHTLEVLVTGQRNKESTGTFIAIDGVTILNGGPIE
jgi:hypothetical protein